MKLSLSLSWLLMISVAHLLISESAFSSIRMAPAQGKEVSLPRIPVPYQVFSHLKKVREISLREAILLSLRYNITVRNSELDRIIQKYQVAIARNQFEPQYSLIGHMIRSGTVSEGTQQYSTSYSLTPSISLTNAYGTSISTNIANSYTANGQLVTIGGLTLIQPLLRGSGRDIVVANLRNTMDGDEQNRMVLKTSLMQTVTDVIAQYYTTLKNYNLLAVDKHSLEKSEKNLQDIQLRVDVGKRPLAELIRQEGDIAGQRLTFEASQRRAQDSLQDLLKLIGLDPDAKLDIHKHIDLSLQPVPTIEESVAKALKNNPSYLQTLIQLRILDRNLMQAKDNKRWELKLVAQGTTPLDWKKGGANAPSTRAATLNLEIPIDNLAIDQGIANAKVAVQKQKFTIRDTKQTLIKNIINAVRNIEVARKQIEIAEENYKFKLKIYENSLLSWQYGKLAYFQVVQDQTDWRDAGTALVNQKIEYMALLATLDNLMGVTLDRWGIQVEY